jgi:hypothetical protein
MTRTSVVNQHVLLNAHEVAARIAPLERSNSTQLKMHLKKCEEPSPSFYASGVGNVMHHSATRYYRLE